MRFVVGDGLLDHPMTEGDRRRGVDRSRVAALDLSLRDRSGDERAREIVSCVLVSLLRMRVVAGADVVTTIFGGEIGVSRHFDIKTAVLKIEVGGQSSGQ